VGETQSDWSISPRREINAKVFPVVGDKGCFNQRRSCSLLWENFDLYEGIGIVFTAGADFEPGVLTRRDLKVEGFSGFGAPTASHLAAMLHRATQAFGMESGAGL